MLNYCDCKVSVLFVCCCFCPLKSRVTTFMPNMTCYHVTKLLRQLVKHHDQPCGVTFVAYRQMSSIDSLNTGPITPVKFFHIKRTSFLSGRTPHCCSCDDWFYIRDDTNCIFFSQVRLQTQPKPQPGQSLLYAGTIDCFKKTLAKEVRMRVDLICVMD